MASRSLTQTNAGVEMLPLWIFSVADDARSRPILRVLRVIARGYEGMNGRGSSVWLAARWNQEEKEALPLTAEVVPEAKQQSRTGSARRVSG